MSELMETSVCNDCGRSFLSEDDNAIVCAICETGEEPQTFKEAMLEDRDIKAYIMRQNNLREKWMMKTIRKHLSIWDRFLFFFYKRLADRFGGGKVVPLHERGGLNETRFGVKVNNVEYWYEEKDVTDYDKF